MVPQRCSRGSSTSAAHFASVLAWRWSIAGRGGLRPQVGECFFHRKSCVVVWIGFVRCSRVGKLVDELVRVSAAGSSPLYVGLVLRGLADRPAFADFRFAWRTARASVVGIARVGS